MHAQTAELFDITTEFDLKHIIEKVRNIVRAFRKSPKKAEILQNYVKIDIGKELRLLLDCKTIAAIDLHIDCLNDVEFKLLKHLAAVLKPAELAIEALCREDMNLCSACSAP